MSDQKGYYAPPAAGYGLYMLVRFLWQAANAEPTPRPAPAPLRAPIITPPPKPAAAAASADASPRPAANHHGYIAAAAAPPVVQWHSDRELVAWRAWRLAILMGDDGDQIGPRLLSLSAPCIWDGPAIRVDITVPGGKEQPSGIYALKPDAAERVEWRRSEHCWVTGWVALSGRVVEHALGYRAERAVIRELRLGVGTHLAVRKVPMLRDLVASLERRYQAPVDPGYAEQEGADRMLAAGFKPQCPELALMFLRPPWWIA